MIAFHVYTRQNLAATLRDTDDIKIVGKGYYSNFEEANTIVNEYIKNHFFKTDITFVERKIGVYSATDFCSYGETIIIETINIK